MTDGPITIEIRRPADWISANHRIHWRLKAERARTWRHAGLVYARSAKVKGLGPSRVLAELVVNARRRSRIDPANYQDTVKAVIDGFVDAGVWPDDSSTWVTGPDMRLGPVTSSGFELLVVRIYPVEVQP